MSDLHLILQSGIIQLIIVCVAFFAIALCFLRSKLDEKNRTIHLLYISGILSFLIVELLSYICVKSDADGKTITSYVSFAATWSSLILSIVAIIYSIVTNNKGENVYAKIEQSVGDLSNSAGKISSVTDTLYDKLSIFESYLNQIEHLSEDTNSAVKEMKSSAAGSKFTEDGSKVSRDEVLHQMIQVGSIYGNAALLACCYAHKKNTTFDLNAVFKTETEYFYGYLVSVSTLLFINFNIDGSTVRVNSLNPNMENYIKQFFWDNPADNIELVKSVQKYFGIVDDVFWKAENNN